MQVEEQSGWEKQTTYSIVQCQESNLLKVKFPRMPSLALTKHPLPIFSCTRNKLLKPAPTDKDSLVQSPNLSIPTFQQQLRLSPLLRKGMDPGTEMKLLDRGHVWFQPRHEVHLSAA